MLWNSRKYSYCAIKSLLGKQVWACMWLILFFWDIFGSYTCYCTSENCFLSSGPGLTMKSVLWSQAECIQEGVTHAWRRLLEMEHPATPLLLHASAGGNVRWTVRGRWLRSPKICGSGKHILNSERIGKVWRLVVSRPTPRSALTIQYITGGSFAVFTRNQKPDLNRSIPTSSCSELREQPGWGNHFSKDVVTKSYKAVSKLCWVTLKGQGNEPWIQGCS